MLSPGICMRVFMHLDLSFAVKVQLSSCSHERRKAQNPTSSVGEFACSFQPVRPTSPDKPEVTFAACNVYPHWTVGAPLDVHSWPPHV